MGRSLSKPVLEKKAEGEHHVDSLKIGYACMQGWSRHMEDCLKVLLRLADDDVLQKILFFGVYDGHGGHRAAEICADHLHEHIAKALIEHGVKEMPTSKQIEAAIVQGHLNFDQFLFDNQNEMMKVIREPQDADEQPEEMVERSGCTTVVVLITPDHIFLANCGDSRAVIAYGAEIKGTEDHKPTLQSEKDRVKAAGGVVINKRVNGTLAVSRSLGDFDYKMALDADDSGEPAPKLPPIEKQCVSPEPVVIIHPRNAEDEMLILACDGVWDVMSNEQCVAYVRYLLKTVETGSLKEISGRLIETCLAKGSRDNLTAIIVTLSDKAQKYDPEAAEKDRKLDESLRETITLLLENDGENKIGNIHDLLDALKEHKIIESMPPGAGIYAKWPLVEDQYNKCRPPPPPEPPEPSPIQSDEQEADKTPDSANSDENSQIDKTAREELSEPTNASQDEQQPDPVETPPIGKKVASERNSTASPRLSSAERDASNDAMQTLNSDTRPIDAEDQEQKI